MLSLCYCCGRGRGGGAESVICIRQKDISQMSSRATVVKTRKGPRSGKDLKTSGSGRANRHSSHLGPHLLICSRHHTGQPMIDFATGVTAAGSRSELLPGQNDKKNTQSGGYGQAAHPSGAVSAVGKRQERTASRSVASSAPPRPRVAADAATL